MKDRTVRFREYLADCRRAVGFAQPWAESGRLTRVAGLVMEAVGLRLPIGSQCLVQVSEGPGVDAEVVGFSGERLLLMPSTDVYGVMPGAHVTPENPLAAQPPCMGRRYMPKRRAQDRVRQVAVGPQLLGRVLDGAGRPLDSLEPLVAERRAPLYARSLNPMGRAPIREPLDVGVRSINALFTVGRGQRLGLFAGSGVGKSILLGMMARYTDADVVVVGLIGERGREVKDFIENNLGAEGLARAVVVAAPADSPPLMRLNGAAYAMAIAEYFRDQGRHVLLIMDSLTRYAMAQREVALAIGEPPATKGYPPSVFSRLPQLCERAGNARSGGSITAFFTVFMEQDDQQDPIADAARSILDGHIVLTRDLADAGLYPAIDIESSISRTLPDLTGPEDMERIRRFKYLYSRYRRSRDLVAVGAYVPGADPVLDEAMKLQPAMQAFMAQDMGQRVTMAEARAELAGVLP